MFAISMLTLTLSITTCTPIPAARSAPSGGHATSGVELCTERYRGVTYHWVRADTSQVRVQVYWRNENSQPIRSLSNLQSWLHRRGQVMLAGMNGGMFHTDHTPVGLLVSEGRVQDTLNPHVTPPHGDKGGSFYVQPNGVFFATRSGQLHITTTAEARSFLDSMSAATQSGPLMIRGSRFTPAYVSADTLSPWTNSRAQQTQELVRPGGLPTRNAVCIGQDGFVYLVMTERGVRGDPFARFLRDQLHCRDALYLDGSYSALHIPGTDKTDDRTDLVTLLAILRR